MPVVTNIAAYKFAPLADLKPLRQRLLARCREADLKGTILLSTEGINLFIAGARQSVDALVAELRAIPGLEDLAPKYSESAGQPFTRMLVRIKKEIIAFGVDGIDPARRTSPKLPARTLKQWLDEGRPLTLLDTRNDYEVKLGTFRGAQSLGIDHFRQFPGAVDKMPGEMKQRPVVMFCTGGIRCEKAGPYMERAGFSQVFQLDGGILKYFEEVGGAHYDGECFVFDQRVGVDPALLETETVQCFRCQAPLTAEERQSPLYVPRESCPHCFRSDAERRAARIAEREAALRRVCDPLPGAEPRENFRPFHVPAAHDGQLLPDVLSDVLSHVTRDEWTARILAGRLRGADREPLAATHRVRGGERVHFVESARAEPPVNADIRILHEDDALIVLSKPAPLPMHPCGRFHRNTLQSILHTAFAPERPRPAHRLDAGTTGLVVCSRTRHFAKLLQPQFERGLVEKTYLARVQGLPESDTFFCEASIGTDIGPSGSRRPDEEGLAARTEFRVRARYADGTALLEARPLTGRTNQIRIHLWHLGLPICGDPMYLPDRRQGTHVTLSPEDPPMMLHAWKMRFRHPLTGEDTTFQAEAPAWAAKAPAATASPHSQP